MLATESLYVSNIIVIIIMLKKGRATPLTAIVSESDVEEERC